MHKLSGSILSSCWDNLSSLRQVTHILQNECCSATWWSVASIRRAQPAVTKCLPCGRIAVKKPELARCRTNPVLLERFGWLVAIMSVIDWYRTVRSSHQRLASTIMACRAVHRQRLRPPVLRPPEHGLNGLSAPMLFLRRATVGIGIHCCLAQRVLDPHAHSSGSSNYLMCGFPPGPSPSPFHRGPLDLGRTP
jgi:hypothetical protein